MQLSLELPNDVIALLFLTSWTSGCEGVQEGIFFTPNLTGVQLSAIFQLAFQLAFRLAFQLCWLPLDFNLLQT